MQLETWLYTEKLDLRFKFLSVLAKGNFIMPFAVNVMLNLPINNIADIRTRLCLRNFAIDGEPKFSYQAKWRFCNA